MPDLTHHTYTNLRIRIYPYDDEKHVYPVEATLSNGSHFPDGEIRIDHDALRNVETDPQQYGLDLFYMLFSNKIREAYDVATGLAQAESDGNLRVQLWIDAQAPELHTLVWERLCQQTQTPLSTSAATPFSRYVELPFPAPDPIAQWPRRMLFAISNPQDLEEGNLAALDVEQEIKNLMQALHQPQHSGLLHVTLMPGYTGLSDELRAEAEAAGYDICDEATDFSNILDLLNQRPYHILHFLGHGRFNRRDDSAMLVMENRNGNAKLYKDYEIGEELKAVATQPSLIFIAACESAKRDVEAGNAYVGLAPHLIQAGIPAVIAMQDAVPIASTQTLTREFYQYLLQHGIVDLALNQARLQLYDRQARDWAIPALFTRLKQGELFTKDPVRSALDAMTQHDIFNPLPADEPYLPVEVLHLSGKVEAIDLKNLSQEQAPTMTMIDAVQKIFAPARAEIGPHGPSLVALVGDDGMGKSVSLRHLGQVTARNSLAQGTTRTVIPVYVDLQDLQQDARIDSQAIKVLILHALKPFWQGVVEQRPADFLRSHIGPVFRVTVDGSDALPDHTRHRAWQALNDFVMENSRHEYIVAFNLSQFDSHELMITDVLMMQPMSRHNIQHFLVDTLKDPAGKRLYDALVKAQLFDLAALPWLLFELLKQTQRGEPPISHTQVLQSLVEDRIRDIAKDKGMRARAAETLYALAWEMQANIQSTLPVDRAFDIMATIRGNRGYDLEDFYQQLIQHDLLEPVGEESLSFTRSIIRAYCCARALLSHPNHERQLDNITATLGRYNRYRWWENTLVLLSGLMVQPSTLIRQILYGVPLSEGEQVFLAARCIQECGMAQLDPQLINYVVSTLLWRLRTGAAPRVTRQVRLIQALEQLKHPSTLPYLVDIACQHTNADALAKHDYEHSTVQLAAVTALRHIVPAPYKAIADLAPQLAKLLNFWDNAQVEALIPYLFSPDERADGIQAVAAFALGDLKTPRAVDAVVRMYHLASLNPNTRRNTATALSQLDTALVTQCAILPLLAPEHDDDRDRWHHSLAYLIGKIRTQDPVARAFLYECLKSQPDVNLKALAIQSLGWLYDVKSKKRFEDIALGDFSSLNIPEDPALSTAQRQLLQRKALEALRHIGDDKTLKRFQQRPAAWSPELERAFYWTIEEIITRQNEK